MRLECKIGWTNAPYLAFNRAKLFPFFRVKLFVIFQSALAYCAESRSNRVRSGIDSRLTIAERLHVGHNTAFGLVFAEAA